MEQISTGAFMPVDINEDDILDDEMPCSFGLTPDMPDMLSRGQHQQCQW